MGEHECWVDVVKKPATQEAHRYEKVSGATGEDQYAFCPHWLRGAPFSQVPTCLSTYQTTTLRLMLQ